jgi:hypothetical protein
LNFFAYMPEAGDKRTELLSALPPFISEGSLEVFRDLPSFSARIRKPKNARSVALLWISTDEELKELAAGRDFLAGVRTVLILPDEDPGTIALAHKLFPAYVAYADDDMAEVISVIRRLARQNGG